MSWRSWVQSPVWPFLVLTHCSCLSIAYKSSGYHQCMMVTILCSIKFDCNNQTLLNKELSLLCTAKSTGYFDMQSKEATAIYNSRRVANGISTSSLHLSISPSFWSLYLNNWRSQCSADQWRSQKHPRTHALSTQKISNRERVCLETTLAVI